MSKGDVVLLQDDRVMSILTGLVIVVAMATLAQRSDSLLDFFTREEAILVTPVNDEAVIFAGDSQVIDVLRNDENALDSDGENIRIVVSPSCGAAEATSDGVLYISNERCIGPQLFAYCVQQGDECPSASVTVNVAAAAPGALRIASEQREEASAGGAAVDGVAALRQPGAQRAAQAGRVVAATPQVTDDVSAPRIGGAAASPAPETSGAAPQIERDAVVAAVRPTAPSPSSIGRLADAPRIDGGTVAAPSQGASLHAPDAALTDDSEPQVTLAPTARPLFRDDGSGAVARQGSADARGDVRIAALSTDAEPEVAAAERPDVTAIESEPAAPEAPVTEVARLEDPTEGSAAARIRDDAVRAIREGRGDPSETGQATPPARREGEVGAGCGPFEIRSVAAAGAMSVVQVNSPCRSGAGFEVEHAGLRFSGRFDATGAGEVRIPVMDSEGVARVVASDGGAAPVSLEFNLREAELTLRIAVAWTAPVNLDLHAFEYAAQFGADGHVWQEHPSGFRRVRRSGGGYLKNYPAAAAGGQSIEVYTFWANSRARRGVARIALDHASRGDVADGDFCEGGALASPDYVVVRSERGKLTSTARGRFEAAQCGQALGQDARYASGALRDLRIE